MGKSYFPYFYVAEDLPGSTFTWTFPPTWTGTTSGTGNNTLTISSFGNYNPPGGFPSTEFISVTSSISGTTSMKVKVYDNCNLLCGGGGEGRATLPVNIAVTQGVNADIYPNPTKTQLKVSCMGETPKVISIFSALGSKLMEVIPQQPTHTLDVCVLPNGAYIVNIQFENQTINKRFTKTN